MSGKFIPVLLGFFLMFSVYFGGEYLYNLNSFKWDNPKKNCNLEKPGQEHHKSYLLMIYKEIFETLSHYIST